MDEQGRWVDNIYIERLWRSIKYELVYLHSFESLKQAREALGKYITFYNNSRPHQALGYKTPNSVNYANIKDSQPLMDQTNKSQISYTHEGDEYSQIQPNFLS